MDFCDVVSKRRTVREWTDKEVDFEVIKRIIEAGMKAPSWDHYRTWQFIVLHTREEKENAYAMPRQFTMLTECPYVIVPLFKCARLNAEWVSKLNPLTTAWCVAENIMLAAVNEGLGHSLRMPLNREHDVVLEKLGVPKGWMTPCFIGIGYPKEDEQLPVQYEIDVEKNIHKGGW